MSELHAIIREIYNRELDRKSNINNSLSIQIGLISLLIGAIYTVISNINHENITVFTFEVTFIILAIIFTGISVFFLFLSNWSTKYKYIPYATGLLTYQKQLESDFKRERGGAEKAEKAVIDYLHEEYAKCADHNAIAHEKANNNLYYLKINLILSIVLIAISAIPISYFKIITPEKAQKVEITNAKELNMPSTVAPPPPPPPPTPPPSRQERGNVAPPPPQPRPKTK